MLAFFGGGRHDGDSFHIILLSSRKTPTLFKLGAAARRENTERITFKISQRDQVFLYVGGQNTCKQKNQRDGLTVSQCSRNYNK